MSEKHIGGTINNWSLLNGCIYGTVTGSNKWTDGTNIITSKVIHIDYENKTVETLNTVYTLTSEYKQH